MDHLEALASAMLMRGSLIYIEYAKELVSMECMINQTNSIFSLVVTHSKVLKHYALTPFLSHNPNPELIVEVKCYKLKIF